jgi:hypothetical protein
MEHLLLPAGRLPWWPPVLHSGANTIPQLPIIEECGSLPFNTLLGYWLPLQAWLAGLHYGGVYRAYREARRNSWSAAARGLRCTHSRLFGGYASTYFCTVPCGVTVLASFGGYCAHCLLLLPLPVQ